MKKEIKKEKGKKSKHKKTGNAPNGMNLSNFYQCEVHAFSFPKY